MQNQIQIFNNEKFRDLRVITLDDGNFWFVGKEIATTLAYSNPSKAVSMHVDEEDRKLLKYKALNEMGKASLWTGNDFSDKWLVNESGLYSLILRSDLPAAKEFKRWITSEVLPSIRKNGSYTAPAPIHTTNTSLQALVQQSEILNGLIRNIVEQEQRLANVESKIQSYEDERVENGQRLLAIDTSDAMPVPELDLASKCRQIVNTYAEATNTRFDDIWHAVYSRLYYQFKISVNQIHRYKNESKLQALVRLGHEKALYSAVCDVCKCK